jgi:hypothetical protein
MPIPLIPVAIFGLAGGAWYAQKRRTAVQPISPVVLATRRAIFGQVINGKLPVEKLQVMAKAYRDQGMIAEATMLDKRIAVATAPQHIKDQRSAIYKAAMSSEKPAAIRAVANEFEALGCTGAADTLRTYAGAVEQNQHDAAQAQAQQQTNEGSPP